MITGVTLLMMTPLEFDGYWTKTYSGSLPIPYLLRGVYPNRWIRFHSLPESKRYPGDETEFQTVLHRHNVVLDELAEPDEELVFSSTEYSETPHPIRDDRALTQLDPNAHFWRTIAKHKVDNDEAYPNYWHLFMSVGSWKSGNFDAILRVVADWTIANVMILSTANQWVYYPYDGGADVILQSSETRDQLRSLFASWLSERADGL